MFPLNMFEEDVFHDIQKATTTMPDLQGLNDILRVAKGCKFEFQLYVINPTVRLSERIKKYLVPSEASPGTTAKMMKEKVN